MIDGFDGPYCELSDLPDHRTTLTHLETLSGAEIISAEGRFGMGEYRFTFRGHEFYVEFNSHGGGTYFFVRDRNCPDSIKDAVVVHFASLLPIAETQRIARQPQLIWVLAALLLLILLAVAMAFSP